MAFARPHRSIPALLLLAALALAAGDAAAAGDCGSSQPAPADSLAARIAAIACRENALWHSPFIDGRGRLASMTVAEAETARLRDGVTPAWKRVVDYWRGSGLLWGMRGAAGAATCGYATDAGDSSPACRAFLVDKPWSAAFVSYVLLQAGVPGFRPSASHIDYVRDAYRRPDRSPYTLVDPVAAIPAPGDLLCYVRGSTAVVDHAGLLAFLADNADAGLAMHCDIAVAISPAPDRLYLVGGNVLQGVTLRMLPLNRRGRFWSLPQGTPVGCAPDNEDACSFNRQNWVALLKLKPLSPLPAVRLPLPPAPVSPGQCCVHCVLGAGIPRCPRTP
ncbi:DUF2272 domain-containing protein [Cognatiluteimonas weifangensis]|uniref:DUF2272 domain-containing protein n=1 Tax=Cognatiluteimonas weifangensis TaxID=2303539 RepID=A0A372DNN4_9GAMM|nr:DUF2272 domain-containing protein [Luteimonas weifangensis]RFP61188.1 DUF2272 domain-containing protein [Luteimonas weifangensis]